MPGMGHPLLSRFSSLRAMIAWLFVVTMTASSSFASRFLPMSSRKNNYTDASLVADGSSSASSSISAICDSSQACRAYRYDLLQMRLEPGLLLTVGKNQSPG